MRKDEYLDRYLPSMVRAERYGVHFIFMSMEERRGRIGHKLTRTRPSTMMDEKLEARLEACFERVTRPAERVSSLDDRPASQEMRDLLEEIDEIGALNDKIAVRHEGDDARRPSFSIGRSGADRGVRFAAIPMGHEFTSPVLALLQARGHPPKVEADVIERIQALRSHDGSDFAFEYGL